MYTVVRGPSKYTLLKEMSEIWSTVMQLIPSVYSIPFLPGCQTLLSPSSSEPDTSLSRASSKGALKSDDIGEEGEAVDGKLSIFIHKREDQSSHEVLQPLLRSGFYHSDFYVQ